MPTFGALAVSDFTQSIGVNTHVQFSWTSYANTALVESELNYIGVSNVRDSFLNPNAAPLFENIAAATGVKFDFVLASGGYSYDSMIATISANLDLARFVEGVNESDEMSTPISYDGLTGFAATAALQAALYSAVSGSGFSVIGPSYGKATSFSQAISTYATSNFGNTHEYFNNGNTPSSGLANFISNSELVSGSNPLIATEAGYYTGASLVGTPGLQSGVDETVQAKYDLTLLFDDWAAGIQTTYLYDLMDDAADPTNLVYSDHYGLFNANGTPKLAATALHNLMGILKDPGTTALNGILGYQITGMPSTANSLLMEKSSGVFDIAVWNDIKLWNATTQSEVASPTVPVTVNFGQAVQSVSEYDPLAGTTAVETWSNVKSISLDLLDHPMILQIVPATPKAFSLSNFVLTETVGAGVRSGQTTGNLWSQLVANATDTNPAYLSGVTITAIGTRNTVGTIDFNAADKALTYTAPAFDPNDTTDSFTYTLSNGHGGAITGTVAITETAPPDTIYGTLPGTTITAPSSAWTLVSWAAGQTFVGSAQGDDVFYVNASAPVYLSGNNNTINGGNGNYLIDSPGNNTAISLGSGNSTIDLYGSGNTLTAGNGNNVVWKPTGSTAISMGNGNQTITVEGLHNTIAIGIGTSTIIAGTDGSPAGYEQITVGGGTNTIYVGGTYDTVTVNGGTNNYVHSSGGSATILLQSGSNLVQANGTGNTVTALSGINTINASGNSNMLYGGAGTDALWVGGTGNTLTGGSGTDTVTMSDGGNTIVDGTGQLILNTATTYNTIVLGTASTPEEQIYGNVVANHDTIDLRATLAATSWDGNVADLSKYLSIRNSGGISFISVDAHGNSTAPTVSVAELYNTGGLTLQTLLAQAILPTQTSHRATTSSEAFAKGMMPSLAFTSEVVLSPNHAGIAGLADLGPLLRSHFSLSTEEVSTSTSITGTNFFSVHSESTLIDIHPVLHV